MYARSGFGRLSYKVLIGCLGKRLIARDGPNETFVLLLALLVCLLLAIATAMGKLLGPFKPLVVSRCFAWVHLSNVHHDYMASLKEVVNLPAPLPS